MSLPTVSDLVGLRDVGYLHVGVVKTYDDEDLPEVLLRLGLQIRGKNHCRELTKAEASGLLVVLLTRGLAYSVEIMRLEDAQNLAAKLLSDFFPSSATLLTNVDATADEVLSGSYNSFWGTEATCCIAVVARGGGSTAAVWVEEED
jgi:hypothetical protein